MYTPLPSYQHTHNRSCTLIQEFFLPVPQHTSAELVLNCRFAVVSDTASIRVQEFIHTPVMMEGYIPFLEIFLGILGFGLSILFCTTFCRACSRIREQQLERDTWRRNERDGRPPPIYFIPFPRGMSQEDGEDHRRASQCSQELQTPPRYSTTAYSGLPPSYNDLERKPDDLPPPYTEYNIPVYPSAPTPPTDVV